MNRLRGRILLVVFKRLLTVWQLDALTALAQDGDWRNDSLVIGNTSAGWYAGGTGSPSSNFVRNVDKITYATDNTTASSRGLLQNNMSDGAATANSSDGWIYNGYGQSPSYQASNIQRIIYGNDMVNATTRAYHVGSSTYAYASGNFTDSWLTFRW